MKTKTETRNIQKKSDVEVN